MEKHLIFHLILIIFSFFVFFCFSSKEFLRGVRPFRNCDDLWKYHNIRISGNYVIDVDESGYLEPFTVECFMGDGNDIYLVKTIVHHNSEDTESVRGFEAPGSYIRNVSYGLTDIIRSEQIESLIDISFSCQQYIRWDCKGAMFGFWFYRDMKNWWVGRDGQNQFYWGGAETDSGSCGCFPNCYSTVRNSTCNCDANLKLQWLEDSGLLLDQRRLPVFQLRFGDTGESYEAGQYTLGPLECRARGHKLVDMGTYSAPTTIKSPGYPDTYPSAFHRFKWRVIIRKDQIIELVFPNYDVIHFGAYNSVPNCRYVVEVDIRNSTGNIIGSIRREKSSPPYFISDGRETIIDLTLTTCNQKTQIEKKGFVAEFRKTTCRGCDERLSDGESTHCEIGPNQCQTITSMGYPFPHYIYENFGQNHSHVWKISTIEGYIIQIEFNDFDIIFTPGIHYCEADLLTVFDIQFNETIKTGTYCNINKFNIGKLQSNSSEILLKLNTTFKRVGNSRGFHATVRAVPKTKIIKKWINNIAEGKSADQSSTRSGLEAALAIDGNLERKQQSKCTATIYEHEPWWRVNLQKRHRIYGIQIHGVDITLQNEDLMWPSGQYGLPMPVSGCPSSQGFKWKTGLRFHDVKHEPVQDDKFRYWSQGIMLKGGASKGGIVQNFCIRDLKSNEKTVLNVNANNYGWMAGKYCIFQSGDSCPEGFTSGSITWFDKSNTTAPSESKNSVKGTLPKGVYTKYNTTIFYCCREDGNPDASIKLPKDRPFYLLQYGEECQKVEGMSEIEHFFHYEEELATSGLSLDLIFITGTNQLKFQDPHPRVDVNLFEKGLTLHYCYYDVSDQLKGFQVLVDTTPDTYGFSRHYDDISGISRAVDKPFLSAVECSSYDVTATDSDVITLNCEQPIEGQYVIIFMNDRFDSLRLCEVKVFGEESCGRPLGMATEEILDRAISSSSIENQAFVHHFANARLNSAKAWCAAFTDPDKYIQIDLLYGDIRELNQPLDINAKAVVDSYVTIVGIAMQGMVNAFKSSFVTQFLLLFSNDTIKWTYEEEPIGRQKVYKCLQCESQSMVDGNEIVMYNLLKPILTRYVRVKILNFKIGPCLRLEVIGCRDLSKPCITTLTNSSGVITSPNYPFYYAQYKSCWWYINPGSKHVELDFIVMDLATKDKSGGKCHDSLTIYHPKETVIEATTRTSIQKQRLYPKKIVSSGAIKLHLKTCFRFSVSRFQGFYAKYKASDCPGCGIGDSVSNNIHNCTSNCGRILSINYPLNYINNHRSQWLITAPQDYYVNITVEDFDVPNTSTGASSNDCIFDHISFTDVSTRHLIGRYCNAKRPPKYILSNWNQILIEFNTDSSLSGRGFSLTYVSQKFQLSEKLAKQMVAPEGACPPNWSFFRGYCYNAFFEKESLQWYQSEDKCAQFEKGRDGHLVSITDQHEMQVVHYLLINKWKVSPHQSIYIGLIDTNREGFYNWSDGNPMSYTDWSYGSDDGETVATQPDGGAFEDCTVIKIDSSHSTANWHDIPCSLGKRTSQQTTLINTTKIFSDVISSYICKMDSSYSTQQFKLREPLFTNVITEDEEEIYRRVDDNRYFVCENLEVISNLFKCDGTPNCRDGSDEVTSDCDTSGNSCLESQFRCANGRCIAIGMYCDFVDDCGDGSDEMFCERRQCKKTSEFRCNNDQCIPLPKRCDLLTDCKDLSDEGFACTLIATPCNLNTTFQCYYGNCIPLYALCDRHRDCPGKFHEDEQASRCQKNGTTKIIEKRALYEATNIWHSKLIHDQVEKVWQRYERSACMTTKKRTCRDLQVYENIQSNGTYFIEPEGKTTIGMKVECQFWSDSSLTVIHHDSEARLYVRSDVDGVATYWRTITYEYSLESIVALINSSESCKQFISWQCSGTGFRFNSTRPVSYWISRQGIPQMSWGGAPNGKCACYPNCSQPNLPCNCDSEIKFDWKEDSGFITDKNLLPISKVVFGETYKLGQAGYYYVGPLICEGSIEQKKSSNVCQAKWDRPVFKCQSGQIIDQKYKCIYEFDQLGYQMGCRDVSHLRDCEAYQCPPDYVKCTDSYCIPPRYICNGKWDCVGGSDEVGCARYMCPGQYKCANESSCVLLHQLCDGIRHCPLGDDEWFCELTCPENCTCIGLFVDCRNANFTQLPIGTIPKETRKLELTNNRLGPNLSNADFSFFGDLGELILQRNGIQVIKSRKFLQLTNLYKLDLRYNNIKVLESAAFAGLKKVRYLFLEENPYLSVIEPRAFVGLTSLRFLNISNIKNVEILQENVFLQMSSLETLIFRDNGLKIIEKGAFNELTSLMSLDIRDNELQSFPKDMFHALKSLRSLWTDSFKFCCLAANMVPFERCFPPQDEISDCEDLMSNLVQRIILWFLGVVALVANAAVVIWRFQTRLYTSPVSSTLILSLGCADFLMGIYLVVIASVDEYYRGRYIENSDFWKNSILCQFCGFLSTVSSEVSVATLVFITVDRLICISFPFSMKKYSMSLTYRLIIISWIAVILIAGLPLLPIPYFNGKFYARSGTCLALHITPHKPEGWEYSVAIFLCMNLLAFLIIVGCYCYMYKTIRLSRREINRLKARQVRETQVGRQMALIVITNFLCWFPVIVMGMMSLSGLTIPGAAYSWTAVFVFPLNSATNPIIYSLAQSPISLFTFKSSKRDSLTSRSLIMSMKQKGKAIERSTSASNGKLIRAPPGYVSLIEFLRDTENLRPKHLLEISFSISELIKEVHEIGYALGGINFESVYVCNQLNSERLRAYIPDFNAYRVNDSDETDDYAFDMEEFGNLVKRMLRMYHLRTNSSSIDESKQKESQPTNEQQLDKTKEEKTE